jgi:hypothetical protein
MNNVTISDIQFQSASIDLLSMVNSTITTLEGTPKKTTISSSTIGTLKMGAYAYGRSNEFVCTSCVITTVDTTGGVLEKGPSAAGVNIGYSMSGGIITVANTNGALRWAVPGTNLMWSGARPSEKLFQVVDVTQDGTNTYVQTNWSGGFPNVPLASGALFIQVHPAPKFTCTNCTGGADAVDLAQAPAAAPFGTYSKRTYTGNTPSPNFSIWGQPTTITFNVTTPYTGATSTVKMELSSYSVKSNNSGQIYNPFINLKIAGSRVITPSGVTGQQSGDSGLALPDSVSTWFADVASQAVTPSISAENPGTWPTITIEINTDQGVVNP